MKRKAVLGFDPGVNGGFGVIFDDGTYQAYKFESITEYLEILEDLLVDFDCVAYVEELTGVLAGSKIPPPSSFKLGRNLGQIEGILIGLKIPLKSVRAQVWQKGLPNVAKAKGKAKKDLLKDLAQRMFPKIKITLKTADAMLIADYGKQEVFR